MCSVRCLAANEARPRGRPVAFGRPGRRGTLLRPSRRESAVTGRAVRTGVNEEQFHEALARLAEALHGAAVPHLFMGGIASIVLGRTSWTHDIDVFIASADEP